MRFVIVTGMSGGGKSTALRMLEDVGFYCVDNLPVPLIEKFVELIAMPNSEVGKVALGYMYARHRFLRGIAFGNSFDDKVLRHYCSAKHK